MISHSKLCIPAIAALFFFVCTGLHAQSWAIEESFGGDDNAEAFSLVSHADGSVTHIGLTQSFGDASLAPNLHIVHCDLFGNSVWEFVHHTMVATEFNSSAQEPIMSISECMNGDMVLTTGIVLQPGIPADILVMRISPFGMPIWTRLIGVDNMEDDFSSSIIESGDGNIWITGYVEKPSPGTGTDAIVAQFDAVGNLNWSRIYDGGRDELPRCIRETAEGLFVVAGEADVVALAYDALQFAVDGTGTLVWSNLHGTEFGGEGFSSVVQNTNGFLYATGIYRADPIADVWVVQTDVLTGALINGRTYDSGTLEGAWDITTSVTPDNLVLVGENSGIISAPLDDAFFLEISPDLSTVVNYKAIGTEFSDALYAVAFSPGDITTTPPTERGYWAVGVTNQPSGGAGILSQYLVRTNLTGRTACALESPITIQPLAESIPYPMAVQPFLGAYPHSMGFEQAFSPNEICPGVFMPPFAKSAATQEDFVGGSNTMELELIVHAQPLKPGDPLSFSLQNAPSGEVSVTLSDMRGRELLKTVRTTAGAENVISLRPQVYVSGVYVLRVYAQGQVKSAPVVFVE